MLARESLEIGEAVGEAMARAFGADYRAQHHRTFDTICSATQDRQDAVNALLEEPLDAMIVIGGFNSSNTISLAALCAERVPTYHVEDAEWIDPERRALHYRVAGVKHVEADATDWLAPEGAVRVGITAGASTPNNKIGSRGRPDLRHPRHSCRVDRVRFPFLGRSRKAFPTAADFGFLELHGGETRVVLIPSLGGKITELFMGGREWLWTSDVIPLSRGIEGTSYLESGDSGGFDECFPTISSCRVPGWVRSFGGIELPDHGELWSQEPSLEVHTEPDGQRAIFTWQGKRLPYRLQRTVRVAPDGTVVMDYVLSNDGTEKLPFLWSSHPMFPLSPETRLLLPEGARMRVFARHEIELGEVRSEHRWPYVRGSGKVHDFVVPYRGRQEVRLQAVRRPSRGVCDASGRDERAGDHLRSRAGHAPGDLDQQARLDSVPARIAIPEPRLLAVHRGPRLAQRRVGRLEERRVGRCAE